MVEAQAIEFSGNPLILEHIKINISIDTVIDTVKKSERGRTVSEIPSELTSGCYPQVQHFRNLRRTANGDPPSRPSKTRCHPEIDPYLPVRIPALVLYLPPS
jgi:hypothetical protein